jgi:hypothetical protein
MSRLEYLRAIVVESESYLDHALDELTEVKVWLSIHRAKTNLGPFHEFMELVTAQHRRASRVMELMELVRKRMTFTSQQALRDLKVNKTHAQEMLLLATVMRRMAERSGRMCDIAQALFGDDFIDMSHHIVAVCTPSVPLLMAPVKE